MRTSQRPPPEILTEIVSHIAENDRQTLLACLLSCWSLYDIASLPLYSTVYLSSYKRKSFFCQILPVSVTYRLAIDQGEVGGIDDRRKWHLLKLVKVLELDGRMGGPFWSIKGEELSLPSIRTLRVDMSNGRSPLSRGQESRYSSLRGLGIKPKTLVIKHLSFHDTTCILDFLPKSTLSHITRVIYLIEYKDQDADVGRTHDPSKAIPSFGLHQWLSSLHHAPSTLTTVDIVYWTPSPSSRFSTPSNRYTYMRRPEGTTWLDAYFAHIAQQPVLWSEKIRFNFVNTGSFDHDAVLVDEWDYDAVQTAVRKKLLRAIDSAEGEEIRLLSLAEWLEDMRAGGVVIGDVLTNEEQSSIRSV